MAALHLICICVLLLSSSGFADQTDGRIHCLSCSQVSKPEDCETQTLCYPGQICSSQQYITSEGHMVYDLGCKHQEECSMAGYIISETQLQQRLQNQSHVPVALGRRGQDDIVHVCEECCTPHLCNNLLCGGKDNGRLMCATCKDVSDVAFCNKLETCYPQQVCYIQQKITDQFQLYFDVGCMDKTECQTEKLLSAYRAPTMCFKCCKHKYCNSVCKTDPVSFTSTSSTSPWTSKPSPQFHQTSSFTPKPTKQVHLTHLPTHSTSTKPPTHHTISTRSHTHHKTSTRPPTHHTNSPNCPVFTPVHSISLSHQYPDTLKSLACGGKDDIVFLVDGSHNVSVDDSQHFATFVRAFVNTALIGADFAHVEYATYNVHRRASINLNIGSDLTVINQRLGLLMHHTYPNKRVADLAQAIRVTTNDLFSRANYRNDSNKHIVILARDDTVDMDEAVKASEEAHQKGIGVTFIGVGRFFHERTILHKLVSGKMPHVSARSHLFTTELMSGLMKMGENMLLTRCNAKHYTAPFHTPCTGPGFMKTLGCGGLLEDILLVVDTSSSITKTDMQKTGHAIEKLVGGFDLQNNTVRVGVMEYNTVYKSTLSAISYHSQSAINSLIDRFVTQATPKGDANTWQALDRANTIITHQQRPAARKVVILFTHRASNNRLASMAAGLQLHRNNVTVVVVGVGANVDVMEQVTIASDPDVQHVINVPNVNQLLKYFSHLSSGKCRHNRKN